MLPVCFGGGACLVVRVLIPNVCSLPVGMREMPNLLVNDQFLKALNALIHVYVE